MRVLLTETVVPRKTLPTILLGPVTTRCATSLGAPIMTATANQMRLVLHTAAYWLILAVRDAIPKAHALAKAEFTTIRLRLLKVAARVTETASRVRVAFATACPDAILFRHLAGSIRSGVP